MKAAQYYIDKYEASGMEYLIQDMVEEAQRDAYNQALEDVYGYSLILVEPVDPDDDYNVRETSCLIMIDDFKKLKK